MLTYCIQEVHGGVGYKVLLRTLSDPDILNDTDSSYMPLPTMWWRREAGTAAASLCPTTLQPPPQFFPLSSEWNGTAGILIQGKGETY